MLSKALIGVIIAMSVTGYLYYTSTQTQLMQYAAEVNVLRNAHAVQQESINKLESALQNQAQQLNELYASNAAAEAELNRYMSIFSRHDLTRLASARPGLIETRINNGTKDVFNTLTQTSIDISSYSNNP
jgi:Tfp pilus assembly protein PilO